MTALARYDAMCRAIDAAYKVDEVKDIRDKARALEQYSRQARNVEAERQACEIRLRAERKAGKLLGEMIERGERETRGGNRGNQYTAKSHDVTLPDLDDLGISRKQSSDWQKLAEIPQRDFERSLREAERPTTAGIIREHQEPQRKQKAVEPDALWLWGRLGDFERNGLLERDPADVLETMTPEMQDDVHTLAPRVAAWLKRVGEIKWPTAKRPAA
jgi:hypothetical protein